MLDDMFKLFVDPYFKPKKVKDPERANLFELIYSPGNTLNSKEKVNQRREFSWSDLYPDKEKADSFMKERMRKSKSNYLKRIFGGNSVHRTPQKEKEDRRSVTMREDQKAPKSLMNEPKQLYSAYAVKGADYLRQSKASRVETQKDVVNELAVEQFGSATETRLPKIRNPSGERLGQKLGYNNLAHNEYGMTYN